MKFIFRRRKHRTSSTSTKAGDEDVEAHQNRDTRATTSSSLKSGSTSVSKRTSKTRAKRNETQDILAEPTQFVEKLLAGGLFGSDYALSFEAAQLGNKKKVYKEGTLEKQGNVFKTWHKRYFVLNSSSLCYYESKKKFRNGHLPLGIILLKDMVCESGKVGFDVPDPMKVKLELNKRTNLFCIFIENRTYVISAESSEVKEEWLRVITKIYHKAMQRTEKVSQRVKSQALNNAERPVFSDAANVDDLEAEYELQIAEIQNKLNLNRIFSAWQAYTKYNLRQRMKHQRGSFIQGRGH